MYPCYGAYPDKEIFEDKKFIDGKVTNKSGKVTSLKITACSVDHELVSLYVHAYIRNVMHACFKTLLDVIIANYIITGLCFVESERPKLSELSEFVTPEHASDWKTIGCLLQLSSGTIGIIEHDCHHKAVECCNEMFTKWLDIDSKATWKRIKEVLDTVSRSKYNCT